MNKTNLKYLVPNGITFLSLTSGMVSILSAMYGYLVFSGTMIFFSYWLDMMDGFSARKLNAQSEFGLQMDSLADMVSLGVAPALLVAQHLRIQGISIIWLVPFVILFALAGGFRLARFNTFPPKTSNNKDAIGLPITQSGCTLALAVLADNLQPNGFLPGMIYIPLLAVLSIMMVSRMPFPPSSWFFKTHRLGWVLLISLLFLLIILPLFSTWFTIYIVYLVISTGRALYNIRRPKPIT